MGWMVLSVGLGGAFGALTTFSSFALDAYNFFQRGEMLAGGLYLLSSVCLSVVGLSLIHI